MSKTYSVNMGVEQGEDIHKSKLKILPIVKDMSDVLAGELESRGWSVKSGVATKRFGEASAKVDTSTGDVELSSRAEVELIGRGYDHGDDETRGKAAARRDGESRREAVRAQAKERAQKALLDVSEDVRKELHESLREATVAALRKKAAALGVVESETASVNKNGERQVTIKVRV